MEDLLQKFDLSKYFQTLEELHKNAAECFKKDTVVCKEGQPLLQPWPKKKSDSIQQQISAHDALDVQFPAEVLLVDKILRKAEKTRHRYVETGFKSKSNVASHRDNNPGCSEFYSKETKLENSKEKSTIQNLNNNCDTTDKTTTDKKTFSLTNLRSKTQSKFTNNIISNVKNCDKSKSSDVKYKSQEVQLDNSHRAVSTKRSQSGKSHVHQKTAVKNYTAAHTIAPFKTCEEIKKVKPGLTRTQLLRENKIKSTSNLKSTKVESKRSTSSQKLAQVKSKSADYQNHINEKLPILSNICSDYRKEMLPVQNNCINNDSNLEEKGDPSKRVDSTYSENGASKLSKSINEDKENENFTKGSGHTEIENFPFLLQKDGSSLSMPARYLKLLSNCQKLRMLLTSVNKTPQSSLAAESFLSKMDLSFVNEIQEQNIEMVLKRRQMCETYKVLNFMSNNVFKQRMLSSSHFKEVLQAKRNTEYILLKFTELEKDFKQLSVLLPSSSATNGQSTVRKIHNLEPFESAHSSNNPLFWLTKELISDNSKFHLSNKMKYQKKGELDEYMSLMHKLQMLTFEAYVMAEIKKHVLTVLQASVKENCTERYLVEAIRTAYSLLSENGRTFPIMVEDSTEESASTAEI